jgi:hypothetical protein
MSGRKVLVASYRVEDVILIPKWLDLEDNTVVDSWGVKRGVLYVDFVDGRSMEFKAISNARDYDFKYPDDTQLRDPSDYGFGDEDFDDQEQEEEKKIDNSTIVCGIVCTKCNNVLPPHTCEEHLDINNPIHKCPHK